MNDKPDQDQKLNSKGRKASTQALSYAEMKLREWHETELWDLAERLDVSMTKIVKDFIAERRK